MLEIQQCAAPASRFNRPAMPVGHPKVRAFYAIAGSPAGMAVHDSAAAANQTQGSPGKRRRTREVQGAAACSNARRRFPRVRCAYPGYVPCVPVALAGNINGR